MHLGHSENDRDLNRRATTCSLLGYASAESWNGKQSQGQNPGTPIEDTSISSGVLTTVPNIDLGKVGFVGCKDE